ncbi:c-type cytochrome biogenesis protein CcmI [Paracoccus sp. DMF-8]|uniref:c-type cytochrome biogenesis protein CcmI n=1 Tax=Paracoccus sp. DMF-8 TaxID=3019445 RepID=UPI0023E437D7|nr:c-type cytochrome biogenesis protein CcmI [Paracoccus sp. DMF-8]MDF3607762.1 c-type cytochrome biogenesis protein CcmI [Paracoccus sp. DMF-8]
MFWIICAAMLAVVVLSILAPFLRQQTEPAEPTAAYDLRVYRDQLREVDRDLDRGVIEPTDAERLRVEIGRKVLEADRALQKAQAASRGPGLVVPGIALAAVVGISAAMYYRIGAPGMPDAPINARIAAAEARHAERPSQSEAEAANTAPGPRAEVSADDMALIERLREAVARNPNDIQGQRFLLRYESALGNLVAARQAAQQVVTLLGADATAQDHAATAAIMIEAAGGTITPEAEAEIYNALEKDRMNSEARYMAGLQQIQAGRPDRAFPVWAVLLAEGPENAPWIAPIRAIINDLAWFAGEPSYEAPAPRPLPGPDADAVAAAEDMTPEERQQMISGMVEQLETRLATQGGTPEEWGRLIFSLTTIGRSDHARNIWSEAQARFAQTPEALQIVNDAADRAGLAP